MVLMLSLVVLACSFFPYRLTWSAWNFSKHLICLYKMWKQIIPADDIFIHEENSSWKMLPRTNSNCNRSGPMQVQSFKKAAASELPNFSGLLHSKSVPPASTCHLPKIAWAWPRWKWFGRWGRATEHGGKGYREATERECIQRVVWS